MLAARSRFFRLPFLLVTLMGATALPQAAAQIVVSSFVQTGSLPRNDDDYTLNAVSLGFAINFGGTTYTDTYVSNNGFITFGAGSSDFSPVAFDANYTGLPTIAAFFTDIDTRDLATGEVNWGTATVDGRAAFVVNWPSVGEYPGGAAPNTFSLILVNRSDVGAGNFDVLFDYQQISWDHGGAVAGYHNGNSGSPLFYQLPGSLESGAFIDGGTNSLVDATNAGTAGGYLLQARDGSFLTAANVVPIPEPMPLALLGIGLGILLLRRRAPARS